MNKVKLKDIAISQTGPFGSQLHEEDYVEFGTPIVTVEHLGETGFTHQNLPLVSTEDTKRLSKYLLQEGDIVFSRVGSVDRNTYVGKEEDGWLFSGRCIRVRVDKSKASPKFLSFYFRQKNFKKMMQDIAVGATMPSLNTTLMDTLPLNIPDKASQQKIAIVLSALDDKIELNRRMNAELEQMARTLYDYWFVQFDFPGPDGKPYKSSNGSMKPSPELNRQIPTDWKVLKLQDALEFEKGTEPGAAAYSETQNDEFDMPFYRVGDIDGQTSTYINSSKFAAKIAKPTDVIVTFDGSVGKMGLGLDGAISGGLRRIHDKSGKISDAGVYAIFGNEYITKTIERYATGSVILHASSAIPYLAIPYDDDIFAKFQEVIEPVFAKIIANRQQSQILANLRDWLLPMLMNGQVGVE